VLSSIITSNGKDKFFLVSGANDGYINVCFGSLALIESYPNKMHRYGTWLLLVERSVIRHAIFLLWMTEILMVSQLLL